MATNGNGNGNRKAIDISEVISEETLKEIEEIKVHIKLKAGERFTSVTFAEKTKLNLLLQSDERRRHRLINDFINMLIASNAVRPLGEMTVEDGKEIWKPETEETKKRGRKLMVYKVVSSIKWSMVITDDRK